ncbi:MAG: hypothetical protein ACOH19_01340 [Rhodoglobus sp.]
MRTQIGVAVLVSLALAGCSAPAPIPTHVQMPPETAEASVTPTASPAAPAKPQDGGSQDGATGEASAMDDGSFRYVIAEGDAFAQIIIRFGVPASSVRHESGERVSENLPIYPGEVLIVSAGERGSQP